MGLETQPRADRRASRDVKGSLTMAVTLGDSPPPSLDGLHKDEKSETVFLGKRRAPLLGAAVCLLLAWGRARHIHDLLAHGTGDYAAGVALLGNAVLLGVFASIAAAAAMSAVLGFPRLIVTPQGLARRSLFRTTTAAWDSLTRFHVKRRDGGKALHATADVIGANASPRLRRRKDRLFKIANAYRQPVETIVAVIHSQQAEALAAAAPLSRAASAPDVPAYGVAGFRAPWATLGLLAILAAAFLAEHRLGVAPEAVPFTPNALTLYAFGGVDGHPVLGHGELLRLFSSALLHASAAHLIANAVVLLLVGWPLERLAGRAWFLGIFMASSAAGSVAGLAAYPTDTTLVGASGGITGLSAAMAALSFRLPTRRKRAFMLVRATLVLISAFFPSEIPGGVQIGYAAHLGGALAGAALGVLLLSRWEKPCRLPRFQRAGLAVGAGGLALALLGVPTSLRLSREYVASAQGCIGHDPDAAIQGCTDMLERRPASAAAYNNRAWALHLKGEDALALPDAEKAVTLAPSSAPSLETRAEIYEQLGRRDDALDDYRAALAIDAGLQPAQDGLDRLEGGFETSP